jgi:hypothetical protein
MNRVFCFFLFFPDFDPRKAHNEEKGYDSDLPNRSQRHKTKSVSSVKSAGTSGNSSARRKRVSKKRKESSSLDDNSDDEEHSSKKPSTNSSRGDVMQTRGVRKRREISNDSDELGGDLNANCLRRSKRQRRENTLFEESRLSTAQTNTDPSNANPQPDTPVTTSSVSFVATLTTSGENDARYHPKADSDSKLLTQRSQSSQSSVFTTLPDEVCCDNHASKMLNQSINQ